MLAGGATNISAEVIEGQGMTEVAFRRRGRWLSGLKMIAFLLAWMVGAGFGALLLAASSDSSLMLWVWLAAWGFGGLFVLNILLWQTFGTESLISRAEELTIMRRLVLITKPIIVPAMEIRALRWLADDPTRKVTINGWRVAQTAIEIATYDLQLRCARGITEAEANKAIAAVKQRLAVSWGRG
ncbi:hypothetical protein [Devosia sp.]|uniref:hypothetical protein n=1 Tax=Devosia sp. TaxID=1871048 RepID=UPI003A8EB458